MLYEVGCFTARSWPVHSHICKHSLRKRVCNELSKDLAVLVKQTNVHSLQHASAVETCDWNASCGKLLAILVKDEFHAFEPILKSKATTFFQNARLGLKYVKKLSKGDRRSVHVPWGEISSTATAIQTEREWNKLWSRSECAIKTTVSKTKTTTFSQRTHAISSNFVRCNCPKTNGTTRVNGETSCSGLQR